MKTQLTILVLVFIALTGYSQTNPSHHYHNDYVKKNGTQVSGYQQTNQNRTNKDNYSTQGNTNTNTGKSGSRAKDYSPQANNYGKGQTIHTGKSGGQYYYNGNGNKTYVPKQPR